MFYKMIKYETLLMFTAYVCVIAHNTTKWDTLCHIYETKNQECVWNNTE